jgi:hypothetical protein
VGTFLVVAVCFWLGACVLWIVVTVIGVFVRLVAVLLQAVIHPSTVRREAVSRPREATDT